jgi:uncharacterized protein YndB with AHSA1/START domain
MENKKFTIVAEAAMLIRKPVTEVFEAFINPKITTKFWFTKSTGKLEAGKRVTCTWEMYNHSSQVYVKEIEQNKRILTEWLYEGSSTTVEWIFTPRGDNATFVSITHSGFTGDADTIVKSALGSTGGFKLVLAALKALLEHNIQLNLVADRFPDGH